MKKLLHVFPETEMGFSGLKAVAKAVDSPPLISNTKKTIFAFPCSYRIGSVFISSPYEFTSCPTYGVTIETNPEKMEHEVKEIFYRRLFEDRDAFLYSMKEWGAHEDVIALTVYRRLLEKYGLNSKEITETIDSSIELASHHDLIVDDQIKRIERGVNRHFLIQQAL